MKLHRNSKKVLFLFCSSFPYSDGEIYLEDELKVINNRFTKIYIFTLIPKKGVSREIPDNAEVVHIDLQSHNLMFFIFKIIVSVPNIVQEIISMKNMGVKINKHTLKDLFWTLKKGMQFEDFIRPFIKENQLNGITLYSYWNNHLAYGLSRIKGDFLKTVARGHGFDVFFERLPFDYHPFINYKIKNLNHLVICSDFGYKYLKEKRQFRNSSSLSVSKLGVLETRKKGNKPLLAKLTILTISYFIELKRLPLLAEALSLSKHIQVEWIHIGEGFTAVEEYKCYLRGILSNNDNVKVSFRGNLPRADVLKTFDEEDIDLLLNVSSTEGLPVSIMEAFSFGVSTIATNVGGVHEIVNNANGFLLEANPSPLDIWKTIEAYYYLPEFDKSVLKENAYNTWVKNYNAKTNYFRFAEEYLN